MIKDILATILFGIAQIILKLSPLFFITALINSIIKKRKSKD